MTGMQVLHIAHDHPEWTPGGTEIVAHDLARAMGARLLVAATSLQRPGAQAGSLGALGTDLVLHTGAYDRFTMLRADGVAWVDSLGRALAATRPRIVHFHGLDRIGAEAVAAVRRLAPEARIVMTLHDYQLICPNDGLMLTTTDGARCAGASADRCRRCFPAIAAARHALRAAHLRALVDPVDMFLAPSAFLRDRFVAWGIAPERIRLMPNAISLGAAPAAEAPRARRNRFGYFGAISRHKGVLVLLDAAARLARSGSELRVTLHGGLGWADEAFRAEFARRLGEAGSVAQHLGPYAPGEAPRLMCEVDWVVTPSIWYENAPLVALEARAAGRPVIASGLGGLAELVADGVNGLHVPPGDAAALAETMAMAAADPRLWARLAPCPAPDAHGDFVAAHLALYRSLLERTLA
jgi:glycosyltransferase involved in cell wall biosynthesis